MRKIILIAAMALTSAAAQAGEPRSLSTAPAPSDAPATTQTKPLQPQTDATASTAPSTVTPPTARPARRYDDKGYFDVDGYHPFPRRYTDADRDAERPHGYPERPHHRARWTMRRIIAELQRYWIYW